MHFDTSAGSVYYFRSSLCSTTDGRPACTRFEAHYNLEAIAEARLAAVPSLTHLNYDSASIPVGLYRLHPAPDHGE